MRLLVGAVAAALVLAAGAGFKMDVQAAEGETSVCPPAVSGLTVECAMSICSSVTASKDLDLAEQTRIGREAALLVRDFGSTEDPNTAFIEACVAAGPDSVFAAYNGSEVAQVGEAVPASEQ